VQYASLSSLDSMEFACLFLTQNEQVLVCKSLRSLSPSVQERDSDRLFYCSRPRRKFLPDFSFLFFLRVERAQVIAVFHFPLPEAFTPRASFFPPSHDIPGFGPPVLLAFSQRVPSSTPVSPLSHLPSSYGCALSAIALPCSLSHPTERERIIFSI